MIIKRDEAKQRGLTRYFTGCACKYGHVSERLVSNCRCVDCHNAFGSQWKKANSAACSKTNREWRKENRERVRAVKREYYRANDADRVQQAIRSRKWLEANRDKSRASTAEWRKRNLAIAAAAQQRRRSKKLQRTPAWADHEKIRQFFVLARELTLTTGVEHEVDHIYPLQGETVSGLHVETNLRVIPKSANRSKGARLIHINTN